MHTFIYSYHSNVIECTLKIQNKRTPKESLKLFFATKLQARFD